ncbi:MAG: hypothetical protein RBR24_05605 [Candidatus Carbobacillus sp.]|nr:hypothetical protein [Candidatus Carbobacillus sp.]
MRTRIIFFSLSVGLFVLVLVFYASQIVYSERQLTEQRAHQCLQQASLSTDRLTKSEVYRGTARVTTLYVNTEEGPVVLFCDAEGKQVRSLPQKALVSEASIKNILKEQFPSGTLLRLSLGWDFDRPLYEAKIALNDHAWGFVYYDARDGTFLRSLILPPS